MAFQISTRLRDIGLPLQAIDILVASICINRNLKLRTKDNDFNNIRQVEKSFQVEIVK